MRHVLLVSGNPPLVARWIHDAAVAVAVELVGRLRNTRGTRLKGATVERITIRHVQIKNRGHGPGFGPAGIAHHNTRIADFDLGMPDTAVGLGHGRMCQFRSKGLLEEIE